MKQLNENIAEIIGVYIGDGYIYKNGNKYQIGFVGNPRTDVELFERLKEVIKVEWDKEVKFKVRAGGLRMVFRLKQLTDFFINDLNLCFGFGKCGKVKIPGIIFNDWNLAKNTIRGIMDTDGSVFVSKKPGVEKYPAMEINTTSRVLAFQLRTLLLQQGFRVANVRISLSRLSTLPSYKVSLYGRKNIQKWLDEIGFSNKYKEARAIQYSQ